jgi:hypothetical protein
LRFDPLGHQGFFILLIRFNFIGGDLDLFSSLGFDDRSALISGNQKASHNRSIRGAQGHGSIGITDDKARVENAHEQLFERAAAVGGDVRTFRFEDGLEVGLGVEVFESMSDSFVG